MQIGIETITPELARLWLSHNLNNRNIRRHRVVKFRDELLAGRWKLTHQGIAFNCDGSLKDGQHRLLAIDESGVTVKMVVARGLTDDVIPYVDRGSIRHIHDNGKMMGIDVTQNDVSVANAAMFCPKGIGHLASTDEQEVLDFIKQHEEAILFVRCTRKKGLTQSSVLAAFVRAFYYCDKSSLSRCLKLLLDGIDTDYKPSEMAIISFRDFCLRNQCRGYSQQVEFYQRTQRAIKAFMNGEELKLIKPTAEDIYPIRELA
jgi:hypothetical protein